MYRLAALAVLLLSPTQVFANEVTYLCDVKNKGNGFIQPQFAVGYNEETGAVFVYDPLIEHFVGQPVAGKITEDSSKKRVFTWNVHTKSSSGQNTRMAYRAAVFLKDGKVLVTAKPHGYSNNFTARGKCKISKTKLSGS